MRHTDSQQILSLGKLHQVGGEGLTHPIDANTFLVTGDYPVLIECGSKLGYSLLKQRLVEYNVSVEDIKLVLATHCDFDHVSGFSMLSHESDALLLVSTKDKQAVESGDSTRTEAVYYGEKAEPMTVGGEVEDGFCLKLGEIAIRAIHTPWHTPGSVCYRIDQSNTSTLIGSDTLFGWYFINRMESLDDDIRQGKESLKRLRMERGLTHVAIGHAMRGIRADADDRLEDLERQFAPIHLTPLVEEAEQEGRVYIDPWIKLPGISYKY